MPGSTRSYEFAKRLVARGDTVYVVTSNWQGRSKLSFSKESGINVYWAPLSYSNKMNFIYRIFIFFKFLWFVKIIGQKLKYDLIIASSTPITVAIPALFLKKVKKVKLVLEIRDLWPQLPIAIGVLKSYLLIKIAKFLEKKAYLNSNQIISLSTGMDSELKKKISSNKLSVITNLSDIERFKIENKRGVAFRESISISEDSPLVVYAGAFGRINGLGYLIEIAKEINKVNSSVKFLLAGNGYEKEKLVHKAKKLDLINDSIIFLDYIPKNKMPDLLSAATIATSFFIDLPEMNHNSANKFFDGLAAGKPIMINYEGWQAELLNKTKAGFTIPKNNPKEAAKILNDVLINKEKINQMSLCSERLSLKFDINTNYKKFEQVIDTAYSS
jgi:glycosyltransferase involved in cell wall biosynthesis